MNFIFMYVLCWAGKCLITSCPPESPGFAVAFASFHGANTFTVAKVQTVSMTPLNTELEIKTQLAL